MITPTWQAASNIGALSTTRIGGLSSAPYASFNLGLHVGDDEQTVLANRERLATHLPAKPIWLNQVHSSDVVIVDEAFDKAHLSDADALYTRLALQPLAIMTADCLPILLSSGCGQEIAAIHGGWRGLNSGIIANTLAQFTTPLDKVIAWLGPAIGADKFEVGAEVKSAFCQQSAEHLHAFQAIESGKYLADIYMIARSQLKQFGVTHISGGEYCTVTQQEQFFSYRRDGRTGRMATLIWR
ncbi:peptidoglycan editing factor PgeF [Pseudoalteromonas shioyasakiensis]|uniref:peptidoglycan editing factor PgeF n=1 Tax=Pseudoalteromonas shioyasakiensis TaxID=1190813 RepID=UPI002117BAB4|nr:peptidoglycan editing factor PgeF [Pseudoalteromonas shioyasakiensis]MCQ8877807.1 peptidoglycan editing factor PgeF [Pseudoalteromonas shioyasakiensis]